MESLYRVRTQEEFSWLMEYLRGKDVIPFPNNYFDRFNEDTIVIVTKDLVIKLSYTKEFFFDSALYEKELIEVSDLMKEWITEKYPSNDGSVVLKVIMTPDELIKQLMNKEKYRKEIITKGTEDVVNFAKLVPLAESEFGYTVWTGDGNELLFVDLKLGKGTTKMVST